MKNEELQLMEDGDTWSQHHNNKGWLMRSPALKGWGVRCFLSSTPLPHFVLREPAGTAAPCFTVKHSTRLTSSSPFVCQAICLLQAIQHLSAVAIRDADTATNKARSWRKTELRIRLKINTKYTKS